MVIIFVYSYKMKKLSLSKLLMLVTLLLLAAFEGYWLQKLYADEYRNLKKEVDIHFRDAVYSLQRFRFERDTTLFQGKARIVRTNTDDRFNQKDTVKKTGQFVFKGNPDKLPIEDINPEKILAVNIRNLPSSGGVPPPGLIEVFIKNRLEIADSGMIMSKFDSGRHAPNSVINSPDRISSRIFLRNKTIDSSFSFSLSDSITRKVSRSLQNKVSIKKPSDVKPKSPDSGFKKVMISMEGNHLQNGQSPIFKFLTTNKTLNDSIPVKLVDSAYRDFLARNNKLLPYTILFQKYPDEKVRKAEFEADTTDRIITSKVFVGYNTPFSYQALFSNTTPYILKKMGVQIGGSVLLLLFVLITFVILYRYLMAQHRLTIIKNDFISNITHELKTPIATVNVAIEALRNFGGLQNPERTKEYLDISASELQRLGLLVDKVLKLSMFENQEMTLQKEPFDLKQLVEEVMGSMRLQFEKRNAAVKWESSGQDYLIEADRMHLASVIYNLLDNALKYSKDIPKIKITLLREGTLFVLEVEDEGMGIAGTYQKKIFERFFRVPNGDRHNSKGYGLGLSYVSHIIKQHKGTIEVKSEPGKGSTFTVKIPFGDSPSIQVS